MLLPRNLTWDSMPSVQTASKRGICRPAQQLLLFYPVSGAGPLLPAGVPNQPDMKQASTEREPDLSLTANKVLTEEFSLGL